MPESVTTPSPATERGFFHEGGPMTSEPEAHAFLTDLTRLAQALDDAVLDSGLPAASGENAGIARSLPKSKSPCSDRPGDMRRDALAYVEQWAGNLGSDLRIWQSDTEKTGPTLTPGSAGSTTTAWTSLPAPWWPDAEEELRDKVHRPLADQFTPPLTARENLPTGPLPSCLTEQEMCDAFNVRPATIRSWKNRNKIRDSGVTKHVLVRGEAEHHRLFERCDGTPWPTAWAHGTRADCSPRSLTVHSAAPPPCIPGTSRPPRTRTWTPTRTGKRKPPTSSTGEARLSTSGRPWCGTGQTTPPAMSSASAPGAAPTGLNDEPEGLAGCNKPVLRRC